MAFYSQARGAEVGVSSAALKQHKFSQEGARQKKQQKERKKKKKKKEDQSWADCRHARQARKLAATYGTNEMQKFWSREKYNVLHLSAIYHSQ